MIVATYDYSSVLPYSVGSALAQTYPRIEVIVVGDGCTDDSEQVVASLADPRVRWENLPENSGSQSAPNNRGVELARGELVAYLGHDDLWLRNHLALLVEALLRSRADVAHAVTLQLGPPGTNINTLHSLRPFDDGPREWIAPSATLHGRGLADEIGGWRDHRRLMRPPDVDFVQRVAAAGARVESVPAMTVVKLNSTLRPNCYVEKPCHEQAALAERIRRPRRFVARELARAAWVNARHEPSLPDGFPDLGDPPEEPTPGWEVERYRRIRGLG